MLAMYCAIARLFRGIPTCVFYYNVPLGAVHVMKVLTKFQNCAHVAESSGPFIFDPGHKCQLRMSFHWT